MIRVTRLNGKTYFVNALLIESIEETPDTLITLTTGKKILVLEPASEIVQTIQLYVQNIGLHAAVTKNQSSMEGS